MFCSKCGRELQDDANFCPNCGNDRHGMRGRGAVMQFTESLDAFFKKYDAEWMLKKLSIVLTIVSVAFRIIFNEVETEYHLLAQDDYYVIGDTGRFLIIAACVIAVMLSAGIFAYYKTKEMDIKAKPFAAVAIGIAVSILFMLIRIPAFY